MVSRDVGGVRKHARMAIGVGLETLNSYTNCSEPHRVAVHEGGHAFGFDADHSTLAGSIMNDGDVCDPSAYDIVAIKALYQSVP